MDQTGDNEETKTSPAPGADATLDQKVAHKECLLKSLNGKGERKSRGDNLMMTRIREELDMMINIKKEG